MGYSAFAVSVRLPVDTVRCKMARKGSNWTANRYPDAGETVVHVKGDNNTTNSFSPVQRSQTPEASIAMKQGSAQIQELMISGSGRRRRLCVLVEYTQCPIGK